MNNDVDNRLPEKHHHTAGGVVMDAEDRFLVIVRDVQREQGLVHEVRLPKGHIDPGETAEEAAMREVREESGYQGLAILADLGQAWSRYVFRGKQHIRREQYYLMNLTDPERGEPAPTGAEEALFQPEWLDPDIAAATLTYPTEQEFVRRAITQMGEYRKET